MPGSATTLDLDAQFDAAPNRLTPPRPAGIPIRRAFLRAKEYNLGRARFREIHEATGYSDWPAPADTVSGILGILGILGNGSWNRALAAVGLPPILQSLMG